MARRRFGPGKGSTFAGAMKRGWARRQWFGNTGTTTLVASVANSNFKVLTSQEIIDVGQKVTLLAVRGSFTACSDTAAVSWVGQWMLQVVREGASPRAFTSETMEETDVLSVGAFQCGGADSSMTPISFDVKTMRKLEEGDEVVMSYIVTRIIGVTGGVVVQNILRALVLK